jgi:OOP family OmpA-OmpF porin
MKKILLISGAALALGFAGASSAAALCQSAGNTGTLPGAYIGVGGGWGGMHTPKLNDADRVFSGGPGSETVLGIAARAYGGYLWAIPQAQNLQVGVELGYNYYKKNTYSLAGPNASDEWNYKGHSIDLLGVAKFNLGTSGLNVLAKAGPAYVRQKMTITENNLGALNTGWAGSESKVKPEAVVGIGYDITKNLDINATYAHIFGNEPGHVSDTGTVAAQKANLNKVAPVDMYLLSVAYHFGGLGA